MYSTCSVRFKRADVKDRLVCLRNFKRADVTNNLVCLDRVSIVLSHAIEYLNNCESTCVVNESEMLG